MDYATVFSEMLLIVAVMTIFVNIITEVLKNTFDWMTGSKVINLFVLVLSVVLSLVVCIAYWQIQDMVFTWYYIVAFIIIGFLVAYAAMFGYDKLIKYFEKGDN